MESETDRPTVWDIRGMVLSSLNFAERYAHHKPEHASDVARFSQELRTLNNDLMRAFEKDSVPVHPLDIMIGLTGARAMAAIMAECQPEQCGSLTQFVEGLKHAQAEFMGKVYPESGHAREDK